MNILNDDIVIGNWTFHPSKISISFRDNFLHYEDIIDLERDASVPEILERMIGKSYTKYLDIIDLNKLLLCLSKEYKLTENYTSSYLLERWLHLKEKYKSQSDIWKEKLEDKKNIETAENNQKFVERFAINSNNNSHSGKRLFGKPERMMKFGETILVICPDCDNKFEHEKLISVAECVSCKKRFSAKHNEFNESKV